MNKGMEAKPSPAEKVRYEHDPLVELWCGDDLHFFGEPVFDFCGQVPRLLELFDILLHHGGGHPLALSTGSGHCWKDWWWWERLKLGRWNSRMRRQRKEEGVG